MADPKTKAHYRSIVAVDPTGTRAELGDVRELVREGAVLLDDGVPVPADEMPLLVRCMEDGRPLIQMAAPLHIQLQALRAYDSINEGAADGHLADLAALRALVADPAAEGVDERLRGETHLYDAALKGVRDTVLPQHVVDAWTQDDVPGRPAVDPVLRKLNEDIGIDEDMWMRVVDLPEHRVEQLRAMAREMLRPVLGNSAQLEDLRLLPMRPDEVERANALRRWMEGSDDVREVPEFSHSAMPGYKTSKGMLADRDGVTMLMFRDFMATYAYVWQTDPDTKPRLQADAEERPFPYNLLAP